MAQMNRWSAAVAGLLVVALLGVSGCATRSTVETRKSERHAAYAELPPDQQALVDEGQIAVGMSEDAAYIAWGKPAEVLHSGDANGTRTTWLYHGTSSDSYTYWDYYYVPRPNGGSYLARNLRRDFDVRSYVSAELVFKEGKLESFRTLGKPSERNYSAPGF
ncbi:MAG: hypothetical protein RI897_1525 [Verrucomicrobiota bacterium]